MTQTNILKVLNKVSASLYTHADTHFETQTEKTLKTWSITPEKTALQLRHESTQEWERRVGQVVSLVHHTYSIISTVFIVTIS